MIFIGQCLFVCLCVDIISLLVSQKLTHNVLESQSIYLSLLRKTIKKNAIRSLVSLAVQRALSAPFISLNIMRNSTFIALNASLFRFFASLKFLCCH